MKVYISIIAEHQVWLIPAHRGFGENKLMIIHDESFYCIVLGHIAKVFSFVDSEQCRLCSVFSILSHQPFSLCPIDDGVESRLGEGISRSLSVTHLWGFSTSDWCASLWFTERVWLFMSLVVLTTPFTNLPNRRCFSRFISNYVSPFSACISARHITTSRHLLFALPDHKVVPMPSLSPVRSFPTL